MVNATPLSKADSAVEASDAKEQKASHKKSSSTTSDVYNINDLGMLVDHKLKPHAGVECVLTQGRKGGCGDQNCSRNTTIELVRTRFDVCPRNFIGSVC